MNEWKALVLVCGRWRIAYAGRRGKLFAVVFLDEMGFSANGVGCAELALEPFACLPNDRERCKFCVFYKLAMK